MRKEIFKGVTMLMLIVVLALATAVVSANAQSANRVKASIPFEFVVGDKSLPAGDYLVKSMNVAGDALMIQSADSGKSAVRLTGQTQEMKRSTHARLVFHRYGQTNFLAQVWTGEKIGRELAKSKQERAIERELASIPSKSELAQSTYETIEVVAILH